MPLTVPRFTVADLDNLPDDGNRYEVLSGFLLVTPGPGTLHQGVLARLVLEVGTYLHPAGLARVMSPGLVHTSDDTQLEPDALVVPTRFPLGVEWRDITEHWLAVEVSGKGSRVYDRDYKRNAYLELGVHEVWRVDLRDHVIYVSRPEGPPDQPHAETLGWHPAQMPEPLRLDVRRLFDA